MAWIATQKVIMSKKWMTVFSSLVVAGLLLLTTVVWEKRAHALPSLAQSAGTEMSEPNRPAIKTGTFEELLIVDTRGGVVIPLEKFDLKHAGADWGQNNVAMNYESMPNTPYGYYKLTVTNTDPSSEELVAWSQSTFTPQPNRYYMVSALINSNFTRLAPVGENMTEINLGTYTYGVSSSDPTQSDAQLGNWNGIPENTNGWVRWEWVYSSSLLGKNSEAWFRFFAPRDASFMIADFTIVELPPRLISPWAKGEGVTFRGGPGSLPIQITSITSNANGITVGTTGSRYFFNVKASDIVTTQLLEKNRTVASYHFSKPLTGLMVMSQTANEVVLSNDNLTFGVQADGMVMISPQTEFTLTLTSQIVGAWNRFEAGHLLVVDDYGGFTVNPAIPLGSGRLARTSVITSALDFTSKINDLNFLSQAAPNWQISWTVSPGERIAISTFPPRPYDWDKSFQSRTNLTWAMLPTSVYTNEFSPANFDISILWDFTVRGYGLSYGKTIPAVDDAVVKSHISAIKTQGMSPINYMSAYFYYSRDPQEFINEVIRWRDTYGIEGIYSDGLPSQEWLVAYEEMRMLREAFPAGNLFIHTTGQSINGGPPLALPDIFMPFIDTYATATIRGEWVPGEGQNWAYPRYITSQFRKSNTIGIQKGDRWNIPESTQDDINLVYNGRAWYRSGPYDAAGLDYWKGVYLPKLTTLKQEQELHGGLPNFYEIYYLPKVRQLTGMDLGLNIVLESEDETWTSYRRFPQVGQPKSFAR